MTINEQLENLKNRVVECGKLLETEISLDEAVTLRDEMNTKTLRVNRIYNTLNLIPQKHSEFIAQMEFEPGTDFFNGKKNIYMAGNFGTGKTTLAYLICAVEKIDYRATFRLLRWGEFFSFETSATENIRASYDVDILIVDDFGSDDIVSEKIDNISRLKINELFDYRYANGLRTIFTTNATTANVRDRVSPQTLDRIFESCEMMKMVGESWRKSK